jgi:AraC-like DNA-binding protein
MKMRKEETRPVLFILDTKKELPDLKQNTVISPLHYGDTIELNFVRGIEGETFIGGKRFEYEEKNLFIIPPKYPHTSVYRKGGSHDGDMICAFHINLSELSKVIDLKYLLLNDGLTLTDLAFRSNCFDSAWEAVNKILEDTRTLSSKIIELLRLFEELSADKTSDAPLAKYSRFSGELIDFIEENYSTKLTIEKAAEHFGYSKQYFCKWFKNEMGVTFGELLNAVRIQHARSYLANGYHVDETATLCGFSDPSYFTKLFKRFVGTTPKIYARKSHL